MQTETPEMGKKRMAREAEHHKPDAEKPQSDQLRPEKDALRDREFEPTEAQRGSSKVATPTATEVKTRTLSPDRPEWTREDHGKYGLWAAWEGCGKSVHDFAIALLDEIGRYESDFGTALRRELEQNGGLPRGR